MKKTHIVFVACFFAIFALMMESCHKDDPTIVPIVDTTADTNTGDTDDSDVSIVGQWELTVATQYVSGNPIDVTPFYGEHFYLTFEEDGTLITSDGINEVAMQWTLNGSQLAFIQAPGLDPVMYEVTTLTQENLVIVNGKGTDYVTVMELVRK